MAYITQFYSWSTGNTITAERLNGNITNIVDALAGGTKDINALTLEIQGTTIIDASENITSTGKININADGTAINATGALSFGAAQDVGLWWDGSGVVLQQSTALTNSVTYNKFSHITSGTPANGIGLGLSFEVETSASNNEIGATIVAVTTDVTATSEDFDLTFNLMAAGATAAEKMRIKSTGFVGIGESAPLGKLHVKTADAGSFTPDPASDDLIIEGSTNPGLCVVAPNNQSATIHLGDVDDIDGYYIQVNHSNEYMAFGTNASERMRIDGGGNVLIGGTSSGASSAGNIHLFNGTAPTGSVTNGIILYAEDVTASSELKVRDEAGNVTTLSPHNFSLIPEGASEDMAFSYYSERNNKKINIDMLKAIRILEKLSNEKLVYSI